MRDLKARMYSGHALGMTGIRDQQLRTPAVDGVLEPGTLVITVDRNPDRTELVHRKHQEHHFRCARHVEHHAVAPLDTELAQAGGQFVDP